jgi:hypothetical protein
LIFAATIQMAQETLTSAVAWIVSALTLGLVVGLTWNPFLSLLTAAVLGAVLCFWL